MLYQRSKAKHVISNKSDLNKIVLDTINNMATIVASTLGPGGSGVLIERDGLPPCITKDGVTVAKALGSASAEANVIIEAAKEICLNTAKEAGDGTTTAIILASAIVNEGQEFLRNNPKYNPQRMVNELQQAYSEVVVPFLQQQARPCETEDQLMQVATISANGDLNIAKSVVEAVIAAGQDGTVLIEENQGMLTRVENIDGYIVTTGLKDLGQVGTVFINDRSNQQVKMDQGIVVLYDGSINDLKVPGLIQEAIQSENGYVDGSPIVVFAHSFADQVLDKFAKTTKGGITVIPIKTPRSGLPNGASMFLRDMAAYTGAVVYDPSSVEEMDIEGLGQFDTATVNMYESFIVCQPDAAALEDRINELKSIAKAAFSEMDRSFIRAAIARLTGGISTIYVGGASDLEVREKKARVEDAVEAVRSAIAEGIVPGGCTIHLKLYDYLAAQTQHKPSWNILLTALTQPFNKLMTNCGEDPQEVLSAVRSSNFDTAVFDANEHKVVDAWQAGIIEPVKVIRVSLNNALSVASLLTTLGGLVVVPRNSDLEMQLEIANQSFQNMMSTAND